MSARATTVVRDGGLLLQTMMSCDSSSSTMATKVNFPSRGINVVGNIYFPSKSASDRKHAAIVVSHQWGAVKEQAAGLYAEQLANNGFIALVFDAAYQGESAGEPRGLEDPSQRAEDVRSAVTYLATRSEVDPERIGALGICAGGGYVCFAAQTDLRIKAVATVSAVCLGETRRDGIKGTKFVRDRSTLFESLKSAGEARTAEARGESVSILPIIPDNLAEISDYMPTFIKESFDYYRTPRGQHCRSINRYVARSADLIANFSSFAFNHLISPRPLLMIVGSKADTIYLSKDAIERANEPKELYEIEGKTHVGLYDDTSASIPKLVDFMSKALCV